MRLCRLGWRKELGNKGMLVLLEVRALIALISVFGSNTDAGYVAGIEKLVVCQLNPNWFTLVDWERNSIPKVAASQINIKIPISKSHLSGKLKNFTPSNESQ